MKNESSVYLPPMETIQSRISRLTPHAVSRTLGGGRLETRLHSSFNAQQAINYMRWVSCVLVITVCVNDRADWTSVRLRCIRDPQTKPPFSPDLPEPCGETCCDSVGSETSDHQM